MTKIQRACPVHELASVVFDYYIAYSSKLKHFYGLHKVFSEGIVEEINDHGLFSGNVIDEPELAVAIYEHNPDLVKSVITLCMAKDNLGVKDADKWIDSFYESSHPYSFWLESKDVSELNDDHIRKARIIQCLFLYVTLVLDESVCDDDFSFTDAFMKHGWVEKRTIDDEPSYYYCVQRMLLCSKEEVQEYLNKAKAWMTKPLSSGKNLFGSSGSVAKSAYAECLANTDGKTIFECHSIKLNS